MHESIGLAIQRRDVAVRNRADADDVAPHSVLVSDTPEFASGDVRIRPHDHQPVRYPLLGLEHRKCRDQPGQVFEEV